MVECWFTLGQFVLMHMILAEQALLGSSRLKRQDSGGGDDDDDDDEES
jgi:hypothetical protein